MWLSHSAYMSRNVSRPADHACHACFSSSQLSIVAFQVYQSPLIVSAKSGRHIMWRMASELSHVHFLSPKSTSGTNGQGRPMNDTVHEHPLLPYCAGFLALITSRLYPWFSHRITTNHPRLFFCLLSELTYLVFSHYPLYDVII